MSDETPAISGQREECLKYVRAVSWPKLREWLLEMRNIEKSSDVSMHVLIFVSRFSTGFTGISRILPTYPPIFLLNDTMTFEFRMKDLQRVIFT